MLRCILRSPPRSSRELSSSSSAPASHRLYWPIVAPEIYAGEIGLDPRAFGRGLRLTRPLVLLVAIARQALMALLARAFWPELFSHIQARLPRFGPVSLGVTVILTLLSATLFEELIYGAIFARGRNLYVSWLAHFAADVAGLGLLLLLR
jgi:hypothetical protein